MQFGFFVVDELIGKDAQGVAHVARVSSDLNNNIKGVFYLPPFLRPNQCGIKAGSVVYGGLDEVTGRGFAIYGQDDADYQYYLDGDLEIKKKLTVADDITSTGGDVVAGTISLKNHTHTITAAQYTGTIDPTTGTATGTISGNTEAPQ